MNTKYLLQLSRPGTRHDFSVPSQVTVMLPIDRQQLLDKEQLVRLALKLWNALEQRSQGRQGESEHRSTDGPVSATLVQVRAVYALTKRRGFDPRQYVYDQARVSQPEELSLADASRLIEKLQVGESEDAQRIPASGDTSYVI